MHKGPNQQVENEQMTLNNWAMSQKMSMSQRTNMLILYDFTTHTRGLEKLDILITISNR